MGSADRTSHGPDDEWVQDILGPGWSSRTLTVGPDVGDLATLVRLDRAPDAPPPRGAVLYVHGFADYFFQTHLGDAWAAQGFDFYALDLRRYGRSLRPGQTMGFTTDLTEYFVELDAAAELVRAGHHGPLVVMGHSTGGLVAALWADAHGRSRPDHPHARYGGPDLLVLNSPWLDLNENAFKRTVVTRLIDVLGRVAPRVVVGHAEKPYPRSLHTTTGGSWSFDTTWKPLEAYPARAGFIRTVRRAHARVARGLDVPVPVLVCSAAATGRKGRVHELIAETDSVLSVEQIRDRAPRLGRDVELAPIEGGIHDLALSSDAARERYLSTVFEWVDRRQPSEGQRPAPEDDSEPTSGAR